VRDLRIRGESIRLGQALKLSGLAESGGEARALVEDGTVTVNDEVEVRRGRQLRDGDVIAVGGEALRIEASAS
jgi:ribosome-associated protein